MSSSSTEARLVDVVMPQMGVSVSEGTIVEWRKRPGDWVAYEEPICDISTDKIDTEVPSPAAGRLTEIVVDVGATVEVGTVLARIATDAKPGEAHASEAAAATGETPAPATPDPAPEPAAATPPDAPQRRRYSPVVTRMAAEHGIDLSRIEGTGRGGRVRKQDVLAYLEDGGGATAGAEAPPEPPLHIESPYRPEPAPSGPEPMAAPPPPPAPEPAVAATGRAQPLSRMRKSIGEHMKRSLELAAHCTTMVECDMSAVEARRALIGTTALPIVARCVVDALREYPALNAWLEGDTFTQHEQVHLGVAVSLGEDGLIVPVVRDAQDLSDEGLARRIRELARRARERELSPDDVHGGTFTITNPGQYGAVAATPIINQPQVAILDLEAIVRRPVVITDADGNDAIAIRPMTMLCMSWDHRALDGAYAAQFLTALRRRIESV
ncbi:MAG TPA: dihydrolipoamide acetyltransferase family protein [Solirubrobacteraceae bacterium]|nr:dihydrolipoamide acetyltransferase family protein [Solirubrobacteraceae bacterium]